MLINNSIRHDKNHSFIISEIRYINVYKIIIADEQYAVYKDVTYKLISGDVKISSVLIEVNEYDSYSFITREFLF